MWSLHGIPVVQNRSEVQGLGYSSQVEALGSIPDRKIKKKIKELNIDTHYNMNES